MGEEVIISLIGLVETEFTCPHSNPATSLTPEVANFKAYTGELRVAYMVEQ